MTASNRFQIGFGIAFWVALLVAVLAGRLSCSHRHSRHIPTSKVQIRASSSPVRAESAASRLYRAGNYMQAVQLQREAVDCRQDDARLVYNLACYLCLAGELDESLEVLQRAINLSGKYASTAVDDDDFDALESHPRFILLTHVESARRSFAARHYRSAFDRYRKVFCALPAEDLEAGLLLEMARAAVATDHHEEAFHWLDLALEKDLEIARLAIQDTHFNDLKCDARFYALVSPAFLPRPDQPGDELAADSGQTRSRDPNSF